MSGSPEPSDDHHETVDEILEIRRKAANLVHSRTVREAHERNRALQVGTSVVVFLSLRVCSVELLVLLKSTEGSDGSLVGALVWR